jgi:3-oxoacyl-(acyl-carrier-protein) synthase/phosphopantetheinyl transferase
MDCDVKGDRVAIVGMSVLLPGAGDLEMYWRNLANGVDAITDVPENRWDAWFYEPFSENEGFRADRIYCRRGGFVDEFAEIEVTRFGIPPILVAGTEPDQLIALNVAAAAIADAGGEQCLPDRRRIGVILGKGGYVAPAGVRMNERVRGVNQLVKTLTEVLPELDARTLEVVKKAYASQLGPNRPESAIGLVSNLAASRIANRFDLRGPAYTVDGACASSLLAVDQAVRELVAGRCDLVLAGGVHHCHDVSFWTVFTQLRALSPSQQIRPFDRRADGTLIGEGTGVVVLKRLADAERDGDRIYCVIIGTGVASDGRSTSMVSPNSDGQAYAIQQAWQTAGLDPTAPDAIGLLEAHGTATPAGDAVESETLARTFGPAPAGERAVIGSVKSMIGHTMPAAGIASLVKAALAVHHGVLLPTLHCDNPHPALAGTRFEPISAAKPWESNGANGKRRAAVNAFGFGGINAHVVLEQAPGASGTRTGGSKLGPADRAKRVRLDLGGALVSLDEESRHAIRQGVLDAVARPPQYATGGTNSGILDRRSPIEDLPERHPVTAELRALLDDTAATAAAVMSAGVHASTPGTLTGRAPTETRTVLTVSTEAMPYLRDHCFIRQRADWPDDSDRFPVVPATTIVQHVVEVAEQAMMGHRVCAIHDLRLNRWLVAAPPVEVPVTVMPQGPGRAKVVLGDYSQAVVELAPSYPAEPPAPWPPDTATERAPDDRAEELYSRRLMFHGPLFQGITQLTAMGPHHIRGVITTPQAPGALLDNAGQLLGYWIVRTDTIKARAFPTFVRQISFFGPHPAAGTRLDCLVEIQSVTQTEVEANIQLTLDGRVWAEIIGWRDRRFENQVDTRREEKFPEHAMLSREQRGDWVLVHERWSDLASQAVIMRSHLSALERAEYEQCRPLARRQWLLGRIAVKDAVRKWLWDRGEGAVFPMEIRVYNDGAGRPNVVGLHGRLLPEFDVSLAHCQEIGVALVRRRVTDHSARNNCRLGIDVEEVTERPRSTHRITLTKSERKLLAARCTETGEPQALLFTKFWAAKEAVAKAEGVGLAGRPKHLAVLAAQGTRLLVGMRGDGSAHNDQPAYWVDVAPIRNPEDLPARHYVVAWTTCQVLSRVSS